eukprot:gene12132-biopygen4491
MHCIHLLHWMQPLATISVHPDGGLQVIPLAFDGCRSSSPRLPQQQSAAAAVAVEGCRSMCHRVLDNRFRQPTTTTSTVRQVRSGSTVRQAGDPAP